VVRTRTQLQVIDTRTLKVATVLPDTPWLVQLL
jgi:hypothetical protein